jgi:hypothetical protein
MRDDKAAVDGHPGASAAGEAIEMSDDAKSLGGRSHKGGNKEDQDERTPRLPASRPTSAYDLAVPTLNLPQAALPDTRMPTPAASVPVEDQADLSATSYFEVRSATAIAAEAAALPRKTTVTSADAILPLLIYAVVQANPPKLVSHTMFVQRFRADSLMRGEGEYCLTNMDAVKHFLMHCDIASLGLGTDRILT